jgi:starch phosphorylase
MPRPAKKNRAALPKIHQFNVHPDIPERLSGLEELAYNLHWTWEARAQEVFRRLDADLMEKCGGNPVSLLRRVSRERLNRAAGDEAYLALLDGALDELRRYLAEPGWFQSRYPDRADMCVAYFCMEYGLTACLPIYSGGLGVLAGDHLKSASGLGLPLVAVGLLYNRGYFTQQLDQDGWQHEEYRTHDFSTLPILPVMAGERWRPVGAAPNAVVDVASAAGAPGAEPLKVAVEIADRLVWVRVWRAQVGRISLYLLDSALPENDHAAQRMTDELYGGGPQERLSQELLLGVGGMRALKALGVKPDVCHLNEGHSVFASLERIRAAMAENGLSFLEARQGTGAGTLFTTHTPVPAGFDLFSAPLIESHLATYLKDMGLEVERFMNIGQINRENTDEEFNVAVMALRHSPRRNAVSRLHRRVTAGMMKPGWVSFPRTEMPIESVTNRDGRVV